MKFNTTLEVTGATARLTLAGHLDIDNLPVLKVTLEKLTSKSVKCLILLTQELEYTTIAGLRLLIFTKQKMGPHVDIYVIGVTRNLMSMLEKAGFHHSVIFLDKDEFDEIEN